MLVASFIHQQYELPITAYSFFYTNFNLIICVFSRLAFYICLEFMKSGTKNFKTLGITKVVKAILCKNYSICASCKYII